MAYVRPNLSIEEAEFLCWTLDAVFSLVQHLYDEDREKYNSIKYNVEYIKYKLEKGIKKAKIKTKKETNKTIVRFLEEWEREAKDDPVELKRVERLKEFYTKEIDYKREWELDEEAVKDEIKEQSKP
jgi:hypothetical protein